MNAERKYFDLHTRGIGYVNRLRQVTPKKGILFWPVLLLR
ncbi:Periplasmic protein TonB, links inner and outer membranes [Klebsiella michiganensis]|nr:Periplasmic protein TonB, links inner and outer membranes [Klebsiella michiganensis]